MRTAAAFTVSTLLAFGTSSPVFAVGSPRTCWVSATAVSADVASGDSCASPNFAGANDSVIAAAVDSATAEGQKVECQVEAFSNSAVGAATAYGTVKEKVAVPATTPASPITPNQISRPTAKPTTPPIRKVTITCVQGKLVKKVTAIRPKCPTGYRKR